MYYQNVRGLRTKTHNLYMNALSQDYDILVLSETWLNDSVFDNELLDNRYNVYRRDRQDCLLSKREGGGVLVAVMNKYEVLRKPKWEINCEHLWLILKLRVGSSVEIFNVCALYLPPPLKVEALEYILDNITQVINNEAAPNSQTMILGDFNLPTIQWHTDKNSVSLIPQPAAGSLNALFVDTLAFNEINQYNGVLNANGCILDLVLSTHSRNTISVIENRVPLIDLDFLHPALYITVTIEKFKPIKKKPTMTYKYFKSDYNKINEALSKIDWLENFNVLSNVDDMVALFYDTLVPIIHEHTPLRPSKNERYPVWFSVSLIRCLKEKAKYHSKYKIYGNLQDKLSFIDARERCDKLLTDCFTLFKHSSSLLLRKHPKYIWRYVNSLKGNNSSLPNQMHHKNKIGIGGQEICNLFSEHFNTIYQSTTSINNSQYALVSGSKFDTASLGSIEVTENEVFKALSSLDAYKGAGPDALPSIVLRQCASGLCKPLSIIFQQSLNTGVFPSRWKTAHITPIHKKGDLSHIENYRPISILSGAGKLLESIVVKKMYWHVSQSLNINQHGFMPRRSTCTNLIGYVNDVLEVLDKGGETHAIYTDFSKAFDLVNHDLLLAKLNKLGIHGTLLRWFVSYLENRSQLVVVKGFSSVTTRVPSGVPQGSHLGPILFLIFINDLPNVIRSKVKLYADDLKVYRQIREQKDVDDLQVDLDNISQWCEQNCMSLNSSKCFAIKFSRKHNPFPATYKINMNPLTEVTSIRDLGITVDAVLSFRSHIDNIVKRSSKICGFISRQAKVFRNKELSITLFNSLVRSILEYCCVVWNPGYQVHSMRIEQVLKRFMYHLAYMDNKCKLLRSYQSRLDFYNVMPLYKRRKVADIVMLYKIVNGLVDCPNILEKIKIRVPRPGSRLKQRNTFTLPLCRTNMLQHSPIYRMCNSYNDVGMQTSFDVFNKSSLSSIKLKISNNV